MGRPSIRVKLTITSKDDDRFSNPRTFDSIPDVSLATGLTDRGIRAAYHSKRDSMWKRSGEVYHLRWEELDPHRVKPNAKKVVKCVICSQILTIGDKSRAFVMDMPDNEDIIYNLTSINEASRETWISICALRNACSKGNTTITRRRGLQVFKVTWIDVCRDYHRSWIPKF